MLPLCALLLASILPPEAPTAIKAGHVWQTQDFAPLRLVHDLRQDIAALATSGHFSSAGSGGRDGKVDTERSAMYADPISRDRAVGDWEAFVCLWERLDMVRQELSVALSTPLLEEMEIHYVCYPSGGFYAPAAGLGVDFLKQLEAYAQVAVRE